MTKKDFIQKVCISMASKVIGQNGITDDGDWEHMVSEAEDLVKVLEKEGYTFR